MPEAANTYRIPVRRLRDLRHPPEFGPRSGPWRLADRAAKPYWWRIDNVGTIWRIDVATGRLTYF